MGPGHIGLLIAARALVSFEVAVGLVINKGDFKNVYFNKTTAKPTISRNLDRPR